MDTFSKAIIFTSEEFLQKLLVIILVRGDLMDAIYVWNQFQDSFYDDFRPCIIYYNAFLLDLANSKTDLGLFLVNELLLSFYHFLKIF